jgi:hypothetical protein
MSHTQFLTSQEITLLQADYDELLDSPEASSITIEYYAFEPLEADDIDDVYGTNDRGRRPVISVSICGIHQIVTDRNLALLSFGIFEVGDSIFYIRRDIDLQEAQDGFVAVPESVIFIDPGGVRWEPDLQNLGAAQDLLKARIGGIQICQAVPCHLEKR